MEGHDVFVLELLQHSDLREHAVPVSLAVQQLHHTDLVPGNLRAFFVVEALIYCAHTKQGRKKTLKARGPAIGDRA